MKRLVRFALFAGVIAALVVVGRKLMGGLGPQPGAPDAPKEWPSLVPDPPAPEAAEVAPSPTDNNGSAPADDAPAPADEPVPSTDPEH